MSELKTQYYIQMKRPDQHSYSGLTNPFYDREYAEKFVERNEDDEIDYRVVKVEREVIKTSKASQKGEGS